MRFLVDENIPSRIAEDLTRKGLDVQTVPSGSSDTDVATLAKQEQRALLTLDKDFGNIIAYPPQDYYGIICIRIRTPSVSSLAAILDLILERFDESKLRGKLIVVTPAGIRIR